VTLTLQVLLSGIAAGAVYGIVAIGHTIVYRLTGIVHFAFGSLIGLGLFAAVAVAAGRGPVTSSGLGAGRFALALAAALGACLAAGTLTYLLVIEPFLARGSLVGWVGGTVAVALAVDAAVGAVFPRPSYVFPDPFPFRRIGAGGIVRVGSATFEVRSLFVVGVGLTLAALAGWGLRATRFGRGVTAIAQDQEAAHIVGVPVRTLTAVAFGLVGALAALVAIVAAPGAPFDPRTAPLLGVKGLAAALAVGFASPWRSFGAGAALGLAEAAVGGLEIDGRSLGPSYREVLPLAAVLLLVGASAFRSAGERRAEAQ